MTRFTTDNTDGYSATDLAALNEAFVSICRVGDLPWYSDDIRMASLLDYICEQLLFAFDQGKRGVDLVTAGCQ